MADPRGTRAQREANEKVYQRDGRICAQCGHLGSVPNPLQIDHIEPVSKAPELALDINNMQVLCRKCNIKKSNKTERKRIDWYDKQWLSSIE